MYSFLELIKGDYLQRTRGYGFLITLCSALALGYSFVPPINASYTTISIGDYVGNYSCTWIANVVAIMSSVFVSYFGFYVVNSTMMKDSTSSVGVIMATSITSNLKYLLSKLMSNNLVLLSIAIPVSMMGMMLFFLYGDGSEFVIADFIKAFVMICIPTLFIVSSAALFFEIILRDKTILQYIIFTFLFGFALMMPSQSELGTYLDPFGIKIVTEQMITQVGSISPEDSFLNIGFVINENPTDKRFDFKQFTFPNFFILSRLGWICLSFIFIFLSSFFFNRFKRSPANKVKKDELKSLNEKASFNFITGICLESNYSLLPLIVIELKLMVRNTSVWLWICTFGLMCSVFFIPITNAHNIILPVIWFIHVTNWSKLFYKEYEYGVNLFSEVSFRPVRRLFSAQLLTGILLSTILATPLIIKLILVGNYRAVISVLAGAILIIVFAALLVTISKSRKLFEVLFFMISYANINSVPQLDYFGGLHSSFSYLLTMTIVTALFITASYFVKIQRIN